MNTIIYCLKHPVSKEIRYIGKTDQELRLRLNSHVGEALSKRGLPSISYKNKWVQSLLSQGLRPEIEEVEVVDSSIWPEREKYWIAAFPNLVNGTSGGETPDVELCREGGFKCRGSKPKRKCASDYVGIRRHKNGYWTTQLNLGDKQLYVGKFDDEFEAAMAYDRANLLCVETNVKLNFPNLLTQYQQEDLYAIVTGYKTERLCAYKYIVHNPRCKHWVISIPGDKPVRLKSEDAAVTYVCGKLSTTPDELLRLRTLTDVGTYALPKYKPSVQMTV